MHPVTALILFAVAATCAFSCTKKDCGTARTQSPVSVMFESVLKTVLDTDQDKCMLRLFCEIGSNQPRFGAYGKRIANFFSRSNATSVPGEQLVLFVTQQEFQRLQNQSTAPRHFKHRLNRPRNITIINRHHNKTIIFTPRHFHSGNHLDSHPNKTVIVTPRHHNKTVIVTPRHHNKTVIVTPRHHNKTVIFTPRHHNKTVIVTPRHHNKTVIFTPRHHNKTVIVTPRHFHFHRHHNKTIIFTPRHDNKTSVSGALHHNKTRISGARHHNIPIFSVSRQEFERLKTNAALDHIRNTRDRLNTTKVIVQRPRSESSEPLIKVIVQAVSIVSTTRTQINSTRIEASFRNGTVGSARTFYGPATSTFNQAYYLGVRLGAAACNTTFPNCTTNINDIAAFARTLYPF